MRSGLGYRRRSAAPARTLADLAATAHPRVAEALNDALVRRLVGVDGISHPLLCRLLDQGATPTRSAAERRLLALVRAARLARPETNVRLVGHEVDALWRTRLLAVEIDGFAFHRTRAAFERDRRRDAELLAVAGVSTMRVTWRQLTGEAEAIIAARRGARRAD